MLINWRHYYSGSCTGVAQISVFMLLQSVVDPSHLSPEIALLYLSISVGMIFGLTGVNQVVQIALRLI